MDNIIPADKLQEGDIFLYHGISWISKAIRFFDGTDYNHASIYTGNNIVCEALDNGIIKQYINDSINNSEFVIIKRLNNKPEDMTPVQNIISKYEGKRYAYEQLLLLALICIFRRVNVNLAVTRFITKLLEIAASILVEMMNAGKEALICSEFVYRCYDEALEDDNDPFTIILDEEHPLSKSIISKSKALDNISYLLNRDCLFSYFYYNVINSYSNKKADNSLSFEPVNIKEIPPFKKEMIEPNSNLHNLYEEVEKNYNLEKTSKEYCIDNNVKHALDMFISAYSTINKHNKLHKIPITDNKMILNLFVKTNANFVTPGDLYKAKNLQLIGRIK